MVEVQCPQCEEGVELDDGVVGLFNCPHCDYEFSWNRDSLTSMVFYDMIEFLFGLLTPCLILVTSLWIMFAMLDTSGLEVLIHVGLSIIFCLSYTIVLGIYCLVKKRKTLISGVLLSPIVSVISFYILAETM